MRWSAPLSATLGSPTSAIAGGLSGWTVKRQAEISRLPFFTSTLVAAVSLIWCSKGGSAPSADAVLAAAVGAILASAASTSRSRVPPVRTVTTLPVGTRYSVPLGFAASPVRKIGGRSGVGRRRHPRIDARDGRGGRFAALEGFADAVDAFAAGNEEADDGKQQDQEAEGERIAMLEVRGGNTGAEAIIAAEQPLTVRHPQGLGQRVAVAGRHLVGEGRGGTVGRSSRLLNAGEGGGAGRPRETGETDQVVDQCEREGREDGVARGRRGDAPEAEPRQRGEQAGESDHGR